MKNTIYSSRLLSKLRLALMVFLSVCVAPTAWSHGDVTPQAVDTTGLPELGDEWPDTNPFRDSSEYKALAIEIGASAYNQNCARCHGLEAISGGIAPDLRALEEDFEGDDWYKIRVREGAVRDGRVYMPPFEAIINQEGIWSIRTYIDSRPDD